MMMDSIALPTAALGLLLLITGCDTTDSGVYTGCTDYAAVNYDPEANEDDGSCEYEIIEVVPGCTDSGALNFDAEANEDDGSCAYNGCQDGTESVLWDAHDYGVVQIGGQCWFSENLRSTHYRNGDDIAHLQASEDWSSTETGGYCVLQDEDIYFESFGCLYNGHAVIDERGVCPSGWHVPTDADWGELEVYLGMPESELLAVGNRGVEANVAGHLRGFAHWQNDLNTTDSVGFSALPGGYRGDPTGFIEPDYLGVWWTSDVQDDIFITRRNQVEDTGIGRMLSTPGSGYSLRCVQD